MSRNDHYMIFFLSGYLLIMCTMLQIDAAFQYAFWMLLFSPVLLFWVVYTVKNKTRFGRKHKSNTTFMYGHEKNNPTNL